MPGIYAHYRFGMEALSAMPADVRRSIQRFRRLYDVGLHGPDLFYNIYPTGINAGSQLGAKYHEQTGRAFFTRCSRAIRLERSEAAAAYLYGALCHYVLDSTLHPFISLTAQECGITTVEMETELDRYLLAKDGKMPPNSQKLTQHLKLTEGECETVAKFYPPATGKTVQSALRGTVSATRLLMNPGIVAKAAVSLLGKPAQGMLMTDKPNPRCAHLDESLLELYDEAIQRLPDYLNQIQSHLTYNALLDQDFDKVFG